MTEEHRAAVARGEHEEGAEGSPVGVLGDPIIERCRRQIIEVAAKHGASHVRVFGSRARRDGEEDSDLDLLIALEKGRTLLDLVRLKRELEELTRRPVDVVTENSLSPYMRDHVLAEAVEL